MAVCRWKSFFWAFTFVCMLLCVVLFFSWFCLVCVLLWVLLCVVLSCSVLFGLSGLSGLCVCVCVFVFLCCKCFSLLACLRACLYACLSSGYFQGFVLGVVDMRVLTLAMIRKEACGACQFKRPAHLWLVGTLESREVLAWNHDNGTHKTC